MKINKVTRRNFLQKTALATGMLSIVQSGISGISPFELIEKQPSGNSNNGKLCAFSKLFQFLNYEQLSTVFAEAGLEGIDLTVRPGGHVEPERVKTDLPKAVTAARKNGLEVSMMVTAITDVDKPVNQEVLKTAADNGVVYYRTAYLLYDYSKTVLENLDNARRVLAKLATFNEKTGIRGAYQNHYQQPRIGNPVWDLWYILKDIDPEWMSCQYDIWHAVIEGFSSWETGLRLLSPYIKTRCVKDFNWKDQMGKMTPEAVPLGQGQINFDTYFKLLNEIKLKGFTSLHIEYPVLTDEDINLPLKNKMDKAVSVLKRDSDKLKSLMTKNNYLL
jgi:L-ribulose-5-phosphate 3-epimerase